VQLAVDVEDVVLVAVEDDAAVGQFAERVEVMVPLAFGVRRESGGRFFQNSSMMGLSVGQLCEAKVLGLMKGHAAAVHPEADRHLLARVGGAQSHRATDEGMSASQALRTLAGWVCMSIIRPT